MTNDTDIIALRQPESVDDLLTEIARDGARRIAFTCAAKRLIYIRPT